jgi:hypothetical protein
MSSENLITAAGYCSLTGREEDLTSFGIDCLHSTLVRFRIEDRRILPLRMCDCKNVSLCTLLRFCRIKNLLASTVLSKRKKELYVYDCLALKSGMRIRIIFWS